MRRVVVSTLGKAIGELEVDGTVYPLISPNGYVVQEIEAAGENIKIMDAYRLVGKCAPSMPEEVLMQFDAADIARVMEEVREALLGITEEVLPQGPKAETATTS